MSALLLLILKTYLTFPMAFVVLKIAAILLLRLMVQNLSKLLSLMKEISFPVLLMLKTKLTH